MRKTALFSTLLIVLLASSFLLPSVSVSATEIFSDGFESGDFTAWTSLYGSPTVESANPHHGTYNMEAGAAGANAAEYVYKNLGSTYNHLFMRAYVKYDNLPATNDTLGPNICFSGTLSGDLLARAGAGRTGGGAVRFGFRVVYNSASPVVENVFGSTKTPTTGTYYCLELEVYRHLTEGYVKLYVDGDLEAQKTGIDTTVYTMQYAGLGVIFTFGNVTMQMRGDCVVVADAYIGPEAAGGEEYSFELSETANVTSNLSTQKNIYRASSDVLATGTIDITALLETTKHLHATLITLVETFPFSAYLEALLPFVPLSSEDVLGIAIALIVVFFSIAISLAVYTKRRSD